MNTGFSSIMGWSSLTVGVLTGAYIGWAQFDAGATQRCIDQVQLKKDQQGKVDSKIDDIIANNPGMADRLRQKQGHTQEMTQASLYKKRSDRQRSTD
jgi:hypothetical protein